MRVKPRSFAALAALLLSTASTAAGGTAASVPVLVIDGKGFGHGVGMAQDGAFWMGKAGSSTQQILGHFYPGTSLGKATGSGTVRIAVHTSADGTAVVSFPQGGEVRDGDRGAQAAGFPVRVGPGGQARIRYADGRYTVTTPTASAASVSRAAPASAPATRGQIDAPTTSTTTPTVTTTTQSPATTSTTAPARQPAPPAADGPTTTRGVRAVPSGSGVVGVPARSRTYRGVVDAVAAGGQLRLVNQVDVETYLKGMGEVRDPSWPPASLRAQAIAARTYALRAMGANGELCDSQRCQVYLGSTAEYAAMNKAVTDTSGQVVLSGRALASTVYSANGGGVSAPREEGFGTTGAGYPYLRSAPYVTKDPKPWRVEIALTDVAARLRYPGDLTDVRAASVGPSGRVTSVTLDGSAGPRSVTGLAFDAALGLRSTLLTMRLGSAATAPVAPPPDDAGPMLQAPPEDASVGGPVGIYLRMTRPLDPAPPAPTPSPFAAVTTRATARAGATDTPLTGLAIFTLLALVAAAGAVVAVAGPGAALAAVGPKVAGVRAVIEPRARRAWTVAVDAVDRVRGRSAGGGDTDAAG